MGVKLHLVIACGLTIFALKDCTVLATSTFVVSFQSSGSWSTNEWVEVEKELPSLQQFTSCHWEKIRYSPRDGLPADREVDDVRVDGYGQAVQVVPHAQVIFIDQGGFEIDASTRNGCSDKPKQA